MSDASKIRNLAIIAHIDHGKTTLIDSIFKAAQTFRANARVEERVMDSNALERERGITIRSKLCGIAWGDYRINIIDTPGHADFSGEVERVLSMADSVLLLVDANEGPMPQTRYVLMRSLRLGLKPIVIINKVDRPNADPQKALERTFDLFLELGASEEQADFPILYGSGLKGWMVRDLEKDAHEGLDPLFETIVHYVPPPAVKEGVPFRMQITNIGWNDYLGRIGCGRILEGSVQNGDAVQRVSVAWDGYEQRGGAWHVTGSGSERISHLWRTEGLEMVETEEASAGEIVWLAGPEEILIGDTLAAGDLAEPALAPLEIEEPTVSMFLMVNTGPLAGREGRAVTLRQIKERLTREVRTNVALRMKDLGRADGIKVSGRGELHLAILIEEMRREEMEFCVSRQEVITRQDERGQLLEPFEQLYIDVPQEYQGVVIEKLAGRKGQLVHMENSGLGTLRLEYRIATRGLIGYRGEFLTDTRGLGVMTSRFLGYEPWSGEIASRTSGSLVSLESGPATSHALENLQERGVLFVGPMEGVYAGMVVGERAKPGDLPCNPTKKKHVTNHRQSFKDIAVQLNVPRRLTLDAALEWIAGDELVEITPKSLRVRKAVLDFEERKRSEKLQKAASA